MSTEKEVPKLENQEDCRVSSLLDLPEGTLDYILERLSPQDLCRMAQVCTCLRHRCRSDDLWEKQVRRKWGALLSDVAHQEWQSHATKISTDSLFLQQNQSGSCGSCSGVWPLLRFHSYLDNFRGLTSLFKRCSKMALFICLESGRFWFPAQVYQNVQLYRYDAIVSYDSRTDTFKARSPTGGWQMIEGNIQWDRLRLSPPVETSPWKFYSSNCLNNLKPGDHIEIQKRKRRELPYDWWFAVIGHLETCDEDVNHCHCQYSDMLVVEFKQYRQGSLWRRSVLNKNVYEEQGSGRCWFGGIRKLEKEEIEKWSSLHTSTDYLPFILHGRILHGQNI